MHGMHVITDTLKDQNIHTAQKGSSLKPLDPLLSSGGGRGRGGTAGVYMKQQKGRSATSSDTFDTPHLMPISNGCRNHKL